MPSANNLSDGHPRRGLPSAGSAEFEDPTSAQGTPEQWRSWLRSSADAGGERLRAAGLVLLLGLTAAVVALVMTVFIADRVLDHETQQLDLSVLLWIHHFSSPQMDQGAWFISLFGSELVGVFSVVLLIWFGMQRRWGAAVSLLLVVGGGQLLNDVLKNTIHRVRPSPVGATLLGQAYSFPSGHAMMSMALYTFVAYLGWRLLRGWQRVALVVCLAVLVMLVGLARLYLQVHYPTDVIAGYLAGFIWADAVLIGGHVLGRRRARRTARHEGHVTSIHSDPAVS